MFHYPPVILPQTTDREDYVLTLGMFDDQTLEPIDLSGITLSNTGMAFTGSSWNVNAGSVSTTSSSTFTIPTFPVTGANNLTALTITVPPNLAISQGNPVQILDPTLKNQVTGFVTSYAPATGALTVQIGWTFEFELRRSLPRLQLPAFVPWYDFGASFDAPLLFANFQNGYLMLNEPNIIAINIPAAVVRTIGNTDLWLAERPPGTFLSNMTGTDSVNTRQFLFATQPIFYGGVR